MNPIVTMMSKSTEDYVPEGTPLVRSAIQSRVGLIVQELIFKYSSKKSLTQKFPAVLPWLLRTVSSRFKGYKSLSDNPAFPEIQADTTFIEELKEFAHSLGCHNISFTTLKEEQLFAGRTVLYKNAIVLSMPMNKKNMVKAPQIQAGKEVWRIYDKLGSTSNKVTDFLRRKGYGAQGGAALGGDSNYPLLAQQAGMGCSVCIKECLFFSGDYWKIKKSFFP